jgi:hypothetical protein
MTHCSRRFHIKIDIPFNETWPFVMAAKKNCYLHLRNNYKIRRQHAENILKNHALQILSIVIYEKKWRVRDTIGDGDFPAD